MKKRIKLPQNVIKYLKVNSNNSNDDTHDILFSLNKPAFIFMIITATMEDPKHPGQTVSSTRICTLRDGWVKGKPATEAQPEDKHYKISWNGNVGIETDTPLIDTAHEIHRRSKSQAIGDIPAPEGTYHCIMHAIDPADTTKSLGMRWVSFDRQIPKVAYIDMINGLLRLTHLLVNHKGDELDEELIQALQGLINIRGMNGRAANVRDGLVVLLTILCAPLLPIVGLSTLPLLGIATTPLLSTGISGFFGAALAGISKLFITKGTIKLNKNNIAPYLYQISIDLIEILQKAQARFGGQWKAQLPEISRQGLPHILNVMPPRRLRIAFELLGPLTAVEAAIVKESKFIITNDVIKEGVQASSQQQRAKMLKIICKRRPVLAAGERAIIAILQWSKEQHGHAYMEQLAKQAGGKTLLYDCVQQYPYVQKLRKLLPLKVSCPRCKGDGKIMDFQKPESCKKCHASGEIKYTITCTRCWGKKTTKKHKKIKCTSCRGTGKSKAKYLVGEKKGQYKPCTTCWGKKYKWAWVDEKCTKCKGKGKLNKTRKCLTCGGDGKIKDLFKPIKCPRCKGVKTIYK